MRKIAVGDLGEFWYGDYKEPFEQLEGAVPGHPQGVILKDDEGRLMCAYCGKTFDHLGGHTAQIHGMKAREYKENVGLFMGSALVSERQRQHRIANGLRLWANGGPERLRRARALPHVSHGAPNVAEHQNRTGRCFAQVLQVARSLAAKRKLTTTELSKVGIYPYVIARHFGDMNGLRKALDLDPKDKRRRWSDGQMLIGLRGVADKLGRPPARSDLRRYGLPGEHSYANHFGSYGAACERAGLPINLPPARPVTEDEEIRILNAYATIGNIEGSARAVEMHESRIKSVLAKYGILPLWNRTPGRREQQEFAAEMARRLAGAA